MHAIKVLKKICFSPRSYFIFIAVLGVFFYSCKDSIFSLQPPILVRVSLGELKVEKDNLFSIIHLSVSNPNQRNLEFQVKKLKILNISADNALIGELFEPFFVSLPEYDTQSIPVKFQMQQKNLVKTATSFLKQAFSHFSGGSASTVEKYKVLVKSLIVAKYLGKERNFHLEKEFSIPLP